MTQTSISAAIVEGATTRPDLLVFEVLDKIREPDMIWMAGRVERAFDVHDRVDMLILLTHYEGITFNAATAPKPIKVMLKANKKVRRYAVVGAPAWARAMITVFSPLTPVKEKTFDKNESATARAWVDEAD